MITRSKDVQNLDKKLLCSLDKNEVTNILERVCTGIVVNKD